ncbi:MAG: GNAT family N-acetyltransferase [Chromatiales bacterium]|nr:GNAT family N-acetyltransferase [Gammaproteobacteria bacterium]MCP5351701.1 GNAT family N-acetyltransferase [Chromatiales bacterium]
MSSHFAEQSHHDEPPLMIRPVSRDDLDGVNGVITAAVMGWPLAERVKRMVLALYLYDFHDLEHMDMLVATRAGEVIAVCALETLEERDIPAECLRVAEAGHRKQASLLHGLYVLPDQQGKGIGHRLWRLCVDRARKQGHCGLLVRAQAQAIGFFRKAGMTELQVSDKSRDYAHRFWLPLS